MLMVTFWAIVVAVTVSIEIMCNQWLRIRRRVEGDITGIYYMLVEGTLGTICLVATTLCGSGLHELTPASFCLLTIAAFFAFTGIIIANYAISQGVAGVVLAIFNANASIHVVLSAVFLKQAITIQQGLGVVLCLLGACLVSLGDLARPN